MQSIQGIHLAGQLRFFMAKGGRLEHLGIKRKVADRLREEIGIAQRGIMNLSTNEKVIHFMSEPSNLMIVRMFDTDGLEYRDDDKVQKLTGEQILNLLWQRLRSENNIQNNEPALRLRQEEALEGGYELIADPGLIAKRYLLPTILYNFNMVYLEAMKSNFIDEQFLRFTIEDPAHPGKPDLVHIKYNGCDSGKLNFWVELNEQIITREKTA